MKNNKFISLIKKYKVYLICFIIVALVVSTISVVSYEKNRKETLYSTYATIDELKISNLEYIYFYQNYKSSILNEYASYFATLEIPEGETLDMQIQNEEKNTTWGEYFADYSFQELLEVNFLYELAQENNYKFEGLDEAIDDKLHILQHTALDKNLKYSDYLSTTFIQGTKEKDLIPIIEKEIIAKNYKPVYKDSFNITEEDILKFYEKNKVDYDVVDYRVFTFSVYDEYISMLNEMSASSTTGDSNYKEDGSISIEELVKTKEYREAKEKVLEKANDFYNQVYDEETFKELCIKNAKNDRAKELYEQMDYSLHKKSTYSEADNSIKDWLFDPLKENRSTAIIYDEESLAYNIVYLVNRYKNEGEFVYVKNIFIPHVPSDETNFLISENDKLTTKTKADDIIKEWETTNKSSETFEELAKKYSHDSKILYSNLTEEEMPKVFSSWAYDKSRKSGDYVVLNDDTGYYIVYFDKTAEDRLMYTIKNDLIEEMFFNSMKEITESHKIEIVETSNIN